MDTKEPESVPVEEMIGIMGKLLEESNLAAGLQTGACLISTPGSPRPVCTQVTPQQCAAMRGVYVGGRCT